MFERAGERLAHLNGRVRFRIVWQALILTVNIGELRLQKQLVSLQEALADRFRYRSAHAGLKVVTPLICRVDPAKTHLEGQPREPLGFAFFPGGPVNEGWFDRNCGHCSASRAAKPRACTCSIERFPPD